MKQKYINPSVDIVIISEEDIITASKIDGDYGMDWWGVPNLTPNSWGNGGFKNE